MCHQSERCFDAACKPPCAQSYKGTRRGTRSFRRGILGCWFWPRHFFCDVLEGKGIFELGRTYSTLACASVHGNGSSDGRRWLLTQDTEVLLRCTRKVLRSRTVASRLKRCGHATYQLRCQRKWREAPMLLSETTPCLPQCTPRCGGRGCIYCVVDAL